jgi:Fe-S-cluster containining protein
MQASYFALFRDLMTELRGKPEQALLVGYQDVRTFHCSQCAQCCYVPWHVIVGRDFFEHWSTHFASHPDPRFDDLFTLLEHGSHDEYAKINKHPGTHRCRFLEPDNRCWLHQHFGAEAKPLGCQFYPHAVHPRGGAYLAHFLMKSCQTSARRLAEVPELGYSVIERRPESMEPGAARFALGEGLPWFDEYTLPLWVGLCLDTLQASTLELASPIQIEQQLCSALELLIAGLPTQTGPQARIQDLHLQATYREHFRLLSQPAPALETDPRSLIAWALSLTPRLRSEEALQRLYLGDHPLPRLTAPEAELLNLHLNHYLQHQLLAPARWIGGEVSLCLQHLILGLHVLLIQLLAVLYRDIEKHPLHPEMIRQAINMVEGSIGQDRVWFRQHELDRWSPYDCIHWLQRLLTLDLTAQAI